MVKILSIFLFGGLLLWPLNLLAASCCGGGSASSLILPKTAQAMVDYSFSSERYDGFWTLEGKHLDDPAGSDLNQYQSNFGVAYRMDYRWQISAQLPYVWNQNNYTGIESSTDGLGDSVVSIWYENFDDIKCIWKVTDWESLMPAIYFGSSLTIPTGKSAYSGDVNNSFDVTGRGSYRWDASFLMDKTIYPWNMSVQGSYGKYQKRPVNQEFGRYVEPYDKQLGDRISSSVSIGYTYFLESLDTLTLTTSFNHLRELDAEINGEKDASVKGFSKQSVGLSLAYSTAPMDWIYKLSLNHALHGNGRGENFPTTDMINVGVSYVIR
jgi:hypothetical protein